MLNVNVRAAVLAAQAAISYMRQGARIITIGANVSPRVPFGGLTVDALTNSAHSRAAPVHICLHWQRK